MHLNASKALVVSALLLAMPARASAPDGLVTSKTKLALWTKAGVKSTAVHVDTNEGVVTLHGKVPTAEQRAIAEKTTREIQGVRGVNNLLQVVAPADEKRTDRSDKEIKSLVERQLEADRPLKSSKVSVQSVDKGVVLLTGTARTFSDHLRAVALADRVAGVRRVASEIKSPDAFGNTERVTFLSRPTNKAYVEAMGEEVMDSATDMRISAAVKLRLFTASQVPSTEISVDTEDGVVMLFGMVPTAEVRKVAGLEAAKVSGVARVLNQLEVVPSASKQLVEAKDSDITRDLVLAFKDHREFKGITTSVKNGIVRLTGTVESGWDEVSAVRTVRQVSGVRGVEDQLRVDDDAS